MIGSSLGGLLASLVAASHKGVEALIMMAPAFKIGSRWARGLSEAELSSWRENGFKSFHHYGYGKEMPLHVQFFDNLQSVGESPIDLPKRSLIFHGKNDDVVPVQVSRQFAEQNSNHCLLIELPDGHDLLSSVDTMWNRTYRFLKELRPDANHHM